jgi:hypothetical protein
MKTLLFITLLLFGTDTFASSNLFTCDHQGVCTETTTPISSIKTAGAGMSSATMGKLGDGTGLGNIATNQTECDAQGNCVDIGAFNFNKDLLYGTNNSETSGSQNDGIDAQYTMQNKAEISCGYASNYTMGSAVTIRISNCQQDVDNNVFSLEAKVCHKLFKSSGVTLSNGLAKAGGCDENTPADWSATQTYTNTSLPYINNITRAIDPNVTATISCSPQQTKCTMNVTTLVELSGNLSELGQQSLDGTNDPDNYLTGQQIGKRRSEDPFFQTTKDTLGQDTIDCAKNSSIGGADDGFLLSCDGTQSVNLDPQCTDVAVCVQEETTIITHLEYCDTVVPTNSQVCDISTPNGECEVFLESHDQICDTITPNGECVSELVNAVQTCDVHTPNGSCNNELEVAAKACTYSVLTGACNVELIQSTTTCANTVASGSCGRELNTFTKTCQEDQSELIDCFRTAETTQSLCNATPRYETKYCEANRNVVESPCGISYVATSDGLGTVCTVAETQRTPNGNICNGQLGYETVTVGCAAIFVRNNWFPTCSAYQKPKVAGGNSTPVDWNSWMDSSYTDVIYIDPLNGEGVDVELYVTCDNNSCAVQGLDPVPMTVLRQDVGGGAGIILTKTDTCIEEDAAQAP